MASLRRLKQDTVGLSAVTILVGTALVALKAPWLGIICTAAGLLATKTPKRGLLAALLLCGAVLAIVRGVGERAVIVDPLYEFRQELLAPLIATTSGDSGALAAGLTLGDATYFTRSMRDAMKQSATTHLVALSGFNVAIILGTFRRGIKGKLSKKLELTVCVAVLCGFVAVAGFQPSLLRAALMGTAILFAQYTGRRIASLRLLILTAAGITLFDPRLITHLGFQLSFISSWALLATVGDVERVLIKTSNIARTLGGVIVPSMVAQLGVAPVLLATTGSVMLIGLMINPIVIPITPVISAIAGIQLLLAHGAYNLARLTGVLVESATGPVLGIIQIASSMPGEVSIQIPALAVACGYAGWIIWALKRKPELW